MPDENAPMPFLWLSGQSLDDALAFAGLTLDRPVLAIELMRFGEVCPLH